MDLSKLPRLSETDKHSPPPPAVSEQTTPVQVVYAAAPAGAGADIWINVAIGIIIQLMSGRFWSFAASKVFGSQFTWTFSDADGTPISYTQSVFFMGDVAMVLFGLVLLFEAVLLMIGTGAKLLTTALLLTCVATLLNLLYLVKMMSQGYGLQFFSAIAVAIGVYIAMGQWRNLQMIRGKVRA